MKRIKKTRESKMNRKQEMIENWSWRLTSEGKDFYLEVMCGTSALYEVSVKLTKDEIKLYRECGKEFCEKKAAEVRYNPRKFVQ